MNSLFKWLTILSTLVAICVFLFSIVSPFYNWSIMAIEGEGASYWSYRANFWVLTFGVRSSQSWFFNYWFSASNQYNFIGQEISWVPISIFVVQGLTLVFACASLLINRRIIRSLPVGASSTVLALMFYWGYRLSSFNNFGEGYELGYYLVARSIALFALALALNEVRLRYLQPKAKIPSNFS